MNPLGAGGREPHVSATLLELNRELSDGLVALMMNGG